MGGFKRFIFIVYGICSLLALAALGLSWYGPWAHLVSSWMGIEWFYRGTEALLLICLAGVVVILFRGLFTTKVESVEVTTQDGGTVTITRDAVASRATTIVEADGTCIADEVKVTAKRRGNIRVHVRVQPIATIDVIGKGQELQDELKRGLSDLCGNKLSSVTLEFTEPQTESYTMGGSQGYDAASYGSASYDAGSHEDDASSVDALPASEDVPEAEASETASDDVTEEE
jgi:hypothetical protein